MPYSVPVGETTAELRNWSSTTGKGSPSLVLSFNPHPLLRVAPPRTKKKKRRQQRRLQCNTHPTAPQRPPWSKSLIGFQFLFPTLARLLSDIDIDNPGTLLRIALVLVYITIIVYHYWVLPGRFWFLIHHPSIQASQTPEPTQTRPERTINPLDLRPGQTLSSNFFFSLAPDGDWFFFFSFFSFFSFFVFSFSFFIFLIFWKNGVICGLCQMRSRHHPSFTALPLPIITCWIMYFVCCLLLLLSPSTTYQILTLVPSLPRVLSGIPFYIIIAGPLCLLGPRPSLAAGSTISL